MLTLAIGTANYSWPTQNNDEVFEQKYETPCTPTQANPTPSATQCPAVGFGTDWANIIEDLAAWTSKQKFGSQVTIAGAMDIENFGGTGFPEQTEQWANAYSGATNKSYFDFGACEACFNTNTPPTMYYVSPPPSVPTTGELNHLWKVAWGIANAYPIPEIYNTNKVNAYQWYSLSLYGVVCDTTNYTTDCQPSSTPLNSRMYFPGVTTQSQACNRAVPGQGKPCFTTNNTIADGWNQLFTTISADQRTYFPPPPNFIDPKQVLPNNAEWSTDYVWDNCLYLASIKGITNPQLFKLGCPRRNS